MRAGSNVSAFIGRRREQEALRALLAEARQGRLRVAMIDGEAGIGKTRLLHEVLRHAEDLGFSVFIGSCEEFEAARAFAPLAAAFACGPEARDPRRAAIGALLGDPRRAAIGALLGDPRADPGSIQFRLTDAFLELLEESALDRPLILVVEDLHWSDPATITTLHAALRRLPFTPIVILGTARPVPRPAPLRQFFDAVERARGTLLRLDPLTGDDVADFVEAKVGGRPDDAMLRFLAGAAGNPLFLGELLGAIGQDGSLTLTDAGATVRQGPLPPELHTTILRRISYLSEDALSFLRAASLLGAAFSPADVAVVTGQPVVALVPAIDECVRANVIEEQDRLLRFRHDLIRQALYQDRPPAVREALHLEAGRALAAAGAPLPQVAEQFALGARPGDREAIERIRAAARVARSPGSRSDLLERALALTTEGDRLRDEVRADLAEAMVAGGRAEDAAMMAQALLAGGRTDASRMRAVVTQALRLGGRWVDLATHIDEWLSRGDMADDERAELMAAAAFARGSSIVFDAEQTVQTAREALRLAEIHGDETVVVAALVAHVPAMTRLVAGDLLGLVERAARIAETRPEDRILRHQPHYYLGRVLLSGGLNDASFMDSPAPQLDAADRAFRTGMRLAEEAGRIADLPLYLDGRAHVHIYADRWDDALAEAEAAIAAAEDAGTRMLLAESHSIIAHVAIMRGDLDRAEQHVQAEELLARQLGPQMEETYLAHRSMLAEMRGDLAGALAYRWKDFRTSAERGDESRHWWLTLWFALEIGDGEKVHAVLAWLDERALHRATDLPAHYASFAHALVDGDPHGVRDGLEMLSGGRWNRSHHEVAAFAKARVGLRREALDHFRAAATFYERWGASAWHDVRAARLQRHGVRVPRSRPPRPRTGWEALTDAEQRVALLAAEGLTNPQIAARLFVSRRTIQTHLAHVFEKLGLSSRVELAAMVARRTG